MVSSTNGFIILWIIVVSIIELYIIDFTSFFDYGIISKVLVVLMYLNSKIILANVY